MEDFDRKMNISALPDIHRLLPASPDCEKGVLSSMILAPVEVSQILHGEGIREHHFHVPAHGKVFAALSTLISAGQPADFVTVTKHFHASGTLDSIGGAGFVSELFTFLPTAVNVSYYIEAVKRDHIAREIIRLGTLFASQAYDPACDVKTLAGDFHGALSALLVEKKKRQSVKDCLNEILRELNSGHADGEVIPTGIAEMDAKLALYRGDLLIVTAPTSCGKSALVCQMILTASLDRGSRVAFYPLEMRQKQTIKRALAMRSSVNVKYVRSLVMNAQTDHAQKYAREQVEKVMAAARELAAAKLYIRDDLYSLDAIIADIRAEHGKAPFDFVAIDYLQLIRITGKFERRQLQIAEITQRLKMLANELDCVVIVPSQVNKAGGTREAEDAENDASALVKIEAQVSDSGDISPGRISIWKQREGARGVDLNLTFNGLLTLFEPQKP